MSWRLLTECGETLMKKSVKIEKPTYMQNLVHILYKEYCNSVDVLGERSEVAVILYKALLDCMKHCDKHDIDYSLNYDNN